ncbi:MAG: hypothetical protein L0Z62_19955 [Gemmataceae bacterium]|nr:hypothetical protein [Gemmataceae bacterium]
MRRALWTTLLAVLLLALPARAHGWHVPQVQVNGTCRVYLRIHVGNANVPLAPWYLYFPAEAQSLSHLGTGQFPNWRPQTHSAFAYPPPVPGFAPPGVRPAGLQPVSYHAPAAPGYWYGQ